MKNIKFALAAMIIGSALATTGCSTALADRNDAIAAKHAHDPNYKYMDANWHYFDKTDPYAQAMSGGN